MGGKDKKPPSRQIAKGRTQRPAVPTNQGPLPQREEPDLLALQRAVAIPGLARPADILALQRTVGNRAVQRLLAQRQGRERGKAPVEMLATQKNHQVGTWPPHQSSKFNIIQRLPFATAKNRVDSRQGQAMLCFSYVIAIILQMNRIIKRRLGNDMVRARQARPQQILALLTTGTQINQWADVQNAPIGSMIGIAYPGCHVDVASHVIIKGWAGQGYDSNRPQTLTGQPLNIINMRSALFDPPGQLGGSWQVNRAFYLTPAQVVTGAKAFKW